MELNMPKTRDEAIDTIKILGAPDPNTENKTMLDSLSRAVMRNPSADAQILTADLKGALNDFFKGKTDEQINFILSNATESRGHFTSAQSVRDFCSGKTTSAHSVDVAAIDGLLSAINYSRSFKPIDPASPNAALQAEVNALQAHAPKYIGATFSSRGDEMGPGRIERGALNLTEANVIQHNAVNDGERIIAPNRAVSEASGFKPEMGLEATPKQMPKRQVFDAAKGDYARNAKSTGVPLVGHVSGTMPGNLTVADSLLKNSGRKGLTEDRATTLAGLTAASFHRSAFHSPPEVLVGLRHFLGTEATQASVGDDLTKLYKDSITLMANAGAQQIKEAAATLSDEMAQNPSLTANGTIPLQVAVEVTAEARIEAWGSAVEQDLSDDLDPNACIAHSSDPLPPDIEQLFEEIDRLQLVEDAVAREEVVPTNDNDSTIGLHG